MTRTSIIRKFAVVAAVTAATLVPASAASAVTIISGSVGGSAPVVSVTSYTPSTAYVAAWCESTNHTITIRPEVNVQAGYLNGQWVTYRYYVVDNTGRGTTSGWAGSTLINGRTGNTYYPYTQLVSSTFRAGYSAGWSVYVQIAYYQATGWSYSGWVAQNRSFTAGGGTSTAVHCVS